MGKTATKLREAPVEAEVNPHREALRAAIAAFSSATRAIAQNAKEQEAVNWSVSSKAEAEVAAAREAFEKARAAEKRKAKATLEDAEEKLAIIRETRTELQAAGKDLAERLAWAESTIRERLGDLLKGAPEVRALVKDYRRRQLELLGLAATLQEISRANGLTRSEEHYDATPHSSEWPDADHRWTVAIAALATDADTALPE